MGRSTCFENLPKSGWYQKKCVVVGGLSIYVFSPSETPCGSEQTQRGGARARAPRVSKTGTDTPSPPVHSFVFIRGARARAPQCCVFVPHRGTRTKMKSGTKKFKKKLWTKNNFCSVQFWVLTFFLRGTWYFGDSARKNPENNHVTSLWSTTAWGRQKRGCM